AGPGPAGRLGVHAHQTPVWLRPVRGADRDHPADDGRRHRHPGAKQSGAGLHARGDRGGGPVPQHAEGHEGRRVHLSRPRRRRRRGSVRSQRRRSDVPAVQRRRAAALDLQRGRHLCRPARGGPRRAAGRERVAMGVVLAALAPFRTLPLPAQTAPAGRTTVIAGAHYRAGWLHRLLLGAHYRDLWTAPLEVDVLDLSRVAGGLTPSRCGGRRQTISLRLLGADGREYVFRSVDKDPTLALPPELRATFARSIIQDQISSAHPGGPLVVAPLLDAAGVLHAEPRLVALPDDARLAGFDCVHAGMLGMIEERPTEPPDNEPGFAGAAELAST